MLNPARKFVTMSERPEDLNSKILTVYGRFLETWWQPHCSILSALCPVFTSGYPPVRGIEYTSDIDVNVLVPGKDFLQRIFNYFAGVINNVNDHRDLGYITVQIPRGCGLNYEFDINIRFTIHENELLRTQKHSHNERALGAMYPALALEVARLKLVDGRKGMSTEPAWAKILDDVPKDKAYDYMAGPLEILIAAAEKK